MASLLKRLGGEFTANSVTSGYQWFQRSAPLSSGGFVTVWMNERGDGDGYGITAQLFTDDGAKVGGEIQVNSLGQLNQLNPAVTGLASGGFVVTWTHYWPDAAGGGDGHEGAVKARVFDSSGMPLGPDLLVNTTLSWNQTDSVVAALPGGGFVIGWTDSGGPYVDNGYDGRAQIFDSSGNKIGPEFEINSITQGFQSELTVAALTGGGFVFIWTHQPGDNPADPMDVRGQIFDSDGNKLGAEFLVPAAAGRRESGPDIAALANGGFVVSWWGVDDANTMLVARAQMFDAGGARVGPEVIASNPENGVSSVDVTALAQGGFVVGWSNSSMPFHYERSVRGQAYDAEGNRIGSQFQINSSPVFTTYLDLVTLSSGRIVATWEDDAKDVKAQIFKAPLIGTPAADTIDGTGEDDGIAGLASDDILNGGGGDDGLDGGAGADRMAGGPGDDSYGVDTHLDQVIEQAGGGTDEIVTALPDYTLPDHVEDLTGTNVTGQVLRGNELDNVLTGAAGSDILHLGGAGNDSARGGLGDDLLVVDWRESTDPLTVVSATTFDFTGGRFQGYKGRFGSGSDRSVDFAGIDRFHIMAGSANDVLTGFWGDDILDGGVGDDVLVGEAGTDLLIGGPGIDTVDYSNPFWSDLAVNLGDGPVAGSDGTVVPGHTLWDGFGVFDTLTGIENVKTGNGWDIVYGDGAANRIETGAGLDFLQGGGGADMLVGGSGHDVYSILAADGATFDDTIVELAEGGLDEVRTDLASFTLAGIAEVEGLMGTNPAGQILTGNDLDNYLTGAGGADTLEGGIGNDRLYGGGGADMLRGGIGNDVYEVDSPGDVVEEQPGEGTDTVRTALATYSLEALAHVENLTATSGAAHEFRGNGGHNVLRGAAGNDFLLLHDGGEDRALGGDGNDVIYFGAALSAGDVADGGSGRDAIVLQGNVTAVLTDSNLVGIESISIQSGANTRFGDTANNFYDYSVTTANGNVAAGQQLIVNAQSLRVGEDFTFDGSAESDGKFLVYGGHGVDNLTGGAGADVFLFEGQRWGADDKVDGGGGRDALVISAGSGMTRIVFAADALTSIESISLNNRYATDPSQKPSYDLVLNNGNVAAGGTLIVNGSSIPLGQVVMVEGRAVQNGNLILFGGSGHDTLYAGGGGDLLIGGGGADSLAGFGGADTFRYDSATDSTAAAPDLIADFQTGVDKIDLSRIDANIHAAGDQAFTWIGANAFSGTAGQLRVFADGGYQRIEGDTNGDGNADLVIVIQIGTAPLVQGDFLL